MDARSIETIEVGITPEVETASRLPIYDYFEIVPPAKRIPIDPKPDTWLDNFRQKQGKSMHGVETDQETATATPAPTSQPGTYPTEVAPLGPDHSGYFEGDDRQYLSQPVEAMGGTGKPAATTSADITSGNMPTDSSELLAPDSEAEVPAISFNPGIMSLKGIGRRFRLPRPPFRQAAKNSLNTITELAASFRLPEIDTNKKYAKIATGIGAMALTAPRRGFEYIDLRGEENKRKRRIVIAVLAAAVAVGGYFAKKYVPEIAHSHSSPEAGPIDPGHLFHDPGGAENPLFAHHLTVADHAHAIAVQAGHHLHKAGNALHTVHQHTKNFGHQIGKLNHNLNQYSWNLAHQLRPKKTPQLISRAMTVLGYGAHFVGKGSNTQISMGNGHIINPQQMHQLNEIIVRLGSR